MVEHSVLITNLCTAHDTEFKEALKGFGTEEHFRDRTKLCDFSVNDLFRNL